MIEFNSNEVQQIVTAADLADNGTAISRLIKDSNPEKELKDAKELIKKSILGGVLSNFPKDRYWLVGNIIYTCNNKGWEAVIYDNLLDKFFYLFKDPSSCSGLIITNDWVSLEIINLPEETILDEIDEDDPAGQFTDDPPNPPQPTHTNPVLNENQEVVKDVSGNNLVSDNAGNFYLQTANGQLTSLPNALAVGLIEKSEQKSLFEGTNLIIVIVASVLLLALLIFVIIAITKNS